MPFKQVLACSLCYLLAALPALPQEQHAGQIDAMIPATTLNSQTAQVKEELHWNDLLATAHSGRVRAGLQDGSILSVGSDSSLRVVQHDGASQQTSLEMDFGKVRSQVVKITKPGGKFEMRTPNAVIGVIGTDFFASFDNNRTVVICFEGRVIVTPLTNALIAQNTGQAAANSVTVAAGQMVVITSQIPPGGFQVTEAPKDLMASSATETYVPVPRAIVAGGHPWLVPVLTIVATFGAGLGVALATRGSGTRPGTNTSTPSNNPCSSPAANC